MSKSIHSEPYNLLRTLLIARRKELGLSQYELAERLKRSQSFVAKIEGGERRVDVVEFLDIIHALEADACQILLSVETVYHSTQNTKA